MSQTEEQRRNLYEAQKAWAERVFGELSEEQAGAFREWARNLLGGSKENWDLEEEE